MSHLLSFLFSMAFGVLGAFNRFSSAPLLCVFLILGYPGLTGSVLPAKMPILITLITEAFAFGFIVRSYHRSHCVDTDLVRRFAGPAVVMAILGAVLAHVLPYRLLLSTWALLLLGVVVAWWKAPSEELLGSTENRDGSGREPVKRLVTAEGITYVYVCAHQEIGLLLTSIGALITGLTSFGLGEVETANFVGRCRIPMRVAVGTGLTIALVAVVAAIGAHLALFAARGMEHFPLGLAGVTSLGAIVGTELGRKIVRLTPSSEVSARLVYMLLGASAVWVFAFTLTRL